MKAEAVLFLDARPRREGPRGRTGGGISELREMGSLEWVGIEGRERVLMEEVVRARGEGPVNRATD